MTNKKFGAVLIATDRRLANLGWRGNTTVIIDTIGVGKNRKLFHAIHFEQTVASKKPYGGATVKVTAATLPEALDKIEEVLWICRDCGVDLTKDGKCPECVTAYEEHIKDAALEGDV